MRHLLSIGVILLLTSGLSFAEGPVVGRDCRFEWDAPTTNTDGSPLTDLQEYRLYVSWSSGQYGTPAGVIAQPATTISCQQAGLIADGQYYAVVTAVDQAGNESQPSNEIAFVVDSLGPFSPSGLRVVITITLH